MSKILYYFALIQGLFAPIFLFKTKTYYEDNKKNNKIKKGAIIISNHRTFMDAMVIAYKFFFKRLHYLVTDFYKNKRKIAKFFMSLLGGIFVDGFSLDFIERSQSVIKKGRPILVFPEGDFKFEYEPSKFSEGYIMLAIKTGAKIVPIVNDFNYGLFKRVNLIIGNSIDLSHYSKTELTKSKLKEINEEIRNKFLMLFYKLKRKKAEKFSNKYEFTSHKKGDVIRVFAGTHYHYGVYLNDFEVIQFGHTINNANEPAVVNSVSMAEFCGNKIPEVRILKKRERKFKRDAKDIEKYAKSCLGMGGYNIVNNNCLDFANRVTLKI